MIIEKSQCCIYQRAAWRVHAWFLHVRFGFIKAIKIQDVELLSCFDILALNPGVFLLNNQKGDVILFIDDTEIKGLEDIKIHLLYKRKGEVIRARVLREEGGREKEIKVSVEL